MLTVVLLNPEIPPNTGNIGRLTLGTSSKLIIVGEPAFDLSNDAALKRAGLDYWDKVDYKLYEDWEEYKTSTEAPRFLVTKFAPQSYSSVQYQPDSHIIMGGENSGAPEKVHRDPDLQRVCLPMSGEIRSFNVCNATAVVLFEALRQLSPPWFSDTPFSDPF
ncbi:MAG: tRNA (cytidine(34)-2'-O)-methyltransferase [bacterium]